MAEGKARRQRRMADLIRTQGIGSQEELADALRGLGFTVTQATVSRDLDELGAVKVRKGNGIAYAMPDQLASSNWSGPRLASILSQWVRSIQSAGNLVVIKTPPGSAHIVGVALDQSDVLEIAGTICGDDTIFVATSDTASASRLASQLHQMRIAGA